MDQANEHLSGPKLPDGRSRKLQHIRDLLRAGPLFFSRVVVFISMFLCCWFAFNYYHLYNVRFRSVAVPWQHARCCGSLVQVNVSFTCSICGIEVSSRVPFATKTFDIVVLLSLLE